MSNFQEPWQKKRPGLLARAFGAITKTSGRPDEPVVETRTPDADSKTTSLPNKLLRGWTVPVVGESFNSDSFRRLYALTAGDLHNPILNKATLKINPTNPNSPSGKAVAVFIHGLKVGYVAERICEIVFDGLETLGGSPECECSVYFDTSSGEFKYNSVELRLVLPPTLESNNSGAKVPSLKKGQSLFKIGAFEIVAGAGSILEGLAEGQSIVMSMNFQLAGGGIAVSTVEGSPLFNSRALENPLPISIPAGGNSYYIDTKAIALGAGVFEIFILAAGPIKAESTRTGDSVSDAGNVLSSRYELGLIPSGAWLKLKYEKNLLQSPGNSLFTPDVQEKTKYFWARISQGAGVWSPLGFRGELYRADIDKMSWNLNSVPSFWVLVRATLGTNEKNPTFEVDLDMEAPITLFPQRPVLPARALESKKPTVSQPKPERKPTVEVSPELKTMPNFSLASLEGKQVTTTGFDYLEQSYLVPALESLWI